MTARRVLVTQERIVQVDSINELKCGKLCQFLSDGVLSAAFQYCRLDGPAVRIVDRNRTGTCTSGDIMAQGGNR